MLSLLVLWAVAVLFINNVVFRYKTQADASGVPNRNPLLPYIGTDPQHRPTNPGQHHWNPTGGGGSFYGMQPPSQPFYHQQSSSGGHSVGRWQEGAYQGGYQSNRAAGGSYRGVHTQPQLFHQEYRAASTGRHNIGNFRGGTYHGGYQLNPTVGGTFPGVHAQPQLFHQPHGAAHRGQHPLENVPTHNRLQLFHLMGNFRSASPAFSEATGRMPYGHNMHRTSQHGFPPHPARGAGNFPTYTGTMVGVPQYGVSATTPGVASNDFTHMPYGGLPVGSRRGVPSSYPYSDPTYQFREQRTEPQDPPQSFSCAHEQSQGHEQQLAVASGTHHTPGPQERSIQPEYRQEQSTAAESYSSGDAPELSPQVDAASSGTSSADDSLQGMMEDYIGSDAIDENAFDDVVLPPEAATSSEAAAACSTSSNVPAEASQKALAKRIIDLLLDNEPNRGKVKWLHKNQKDFCIRKPLHLANSLGLTLNHLMHRLTNKLTGQSGEKQMFLKTRLSGVPLGRWCFRFGSQNEFVFSELGPTLDERQRPQQPKINDS